MYRKILFTGLLAAGLLFIAGCKKDNEEKKGVFVSTSAIANIAPVTKNNVTTMSATGAGDVDVVGPKSITEHGICWATSSKPTTANSKVVATGSETGNFTVPITGLTPGAEYYSRAYVINNGQTYYGNEVKFEAAVTIELIKNGDFKLPDDNVDYKNLNSVPDWHTDDAGVKLTGREKSGFAFINDWASFYQTAGDIPGVKSDYKIKFDANYSWSDWGDYPPKIYVTFSSYTNNPATRTPIGSVEITTIPKTPNSDWNTHQATFSIPAGSSHAGKKLAIEWSLENYITEPWGWSNTWYNFDNISVIQTIK